MKHVINLFVVVLAVFSLSACGINAANVHNLNQNATQVNLSSNNYQIVDKVSGSAEVTYVLVFGGMNKKQLFENAYAAMVANANLETGSRALVNVFTENQIGGVPPFYYKRTITVSAHVLEFNQ